MQLKRKLYKIENEKVAKKVRKNKMRGFTEVEPVNSSLASRVLCVYLIILAIRFCSKKSYRFFNNFQAISGKTPPPFPACDWRFNEFANPVAHALHVTWVELMALPVKGPEVGDALFDVIFKGSYLTHETHIRANLMEWINAVGLVLSSLPVKPQSLFILFY